MKILLGAGASLWLNVPSVNAHLVAWHKGMYCLDGVQAGVVDFNSAAAVTPLYQLTKSDWWFHHINGCDNFPPADGDYIDLPAGGSFPVEIASNRAKTSLSYNGSETSDWPDGNTYPEDYNVPTCITSPNMHTQNQSMAAGTVFAISYTSDIHQVTAENLVVFSVRYNTPWKRITSYDVPDAMPACPAGGCICAWGWVPNGCGQPNIYHMPYKCRVTGATSTTPLAAAKPPVWCEGNQTACTEGAKQMVYWNQNDGNNIEVDGYDLEGSHKSPTYNMKLGFQDGAQNDIFVGAASSPASTAPQTTPSNSGSGKVLISGKDSGSIPGKVTPSSNPLPSGGNFTTHGNYTPTGSPPSSRSSSSSLASPSTTTAGRPNKAPSCSKKRKPRPNHYQHRQNRRKADGGRDW